MIRQSTGILCSILVLILLIASNANGHSQRQGYGEECNKTLKCDSAGWLKCENMTCICVKPDEMMYDSQRQMCVAKVNERCKYLIGGGSDAERYEMTTCVINAECNTELGLCICNSGFYEGPNSNCLETKDQFEPCLKNEECDQSKFFICLNGSCDCNSTASIYQPQTFYDRYRGTTTNAQCVGRLENSCLNYACQEGSLCSNSPYSGDPSIGTCKCSDSQYFQAFTTSLGIIKCLKKFDASCSLHIECAETFQCNKGRCECQYRTHQLYDSDVQKCLSVSKGPCKTDSHCSANAACVLKVFDRVFKSEFYQCECLPGFVEGYRKICQLDHGSRCTYEDGSDYQKTCNFLAGLSCIDGFCQCENRMSIYDDKARRCNILAGARCPWRNLEDEMKLREVEKQLCVDNARCVYTYTNFDGTCTCNEAEGFYQMGNRTCGKQV